MAAYCPPKAPTRRASAGRILLNVNNVLRDSDRAMPQMVGEIDVAMIGG